MANGLCKKALLVLSGIHSGFHTNRHSEIEFTMTNETTANSSCNLSEVTDQIDVTSLHPLIHCPG